jgi:hypothetical protein
MYRTMALPNQSTVFADRFIQVGEINSQPSKWAKELYPSPPL